MSARLPGVSEPMRSSRPSTRAAPMVAISSSLRGVSSGSPGRTRRPPAEHRREAPLDRAVEEALDVEHHAQLPERVGRDGAGDIAAEHDLDAALHGAAHDIGRRALGVGGRREAERHAGLGHPLELGVADQVAVDHQQVRVPAGPAASSLSMVPVSLTWMQLGAFEGTRESQLPLQAGRADRIDAEADGREAGGIMKRVVDPPAVVVARHRPAGTRRACTGHEGIGEEVADAGAAQRLDRGVGVARAADVVAVVDDGRGAVGQHLEAADPGGVDSCPRACSGCAAAGTSSSSRPAIDRARIRAARSATGRYGHR